MPPYPGPINDDTPLQFPFTTIKGALVLTPACQGLSRGGFTWLFGTVTVPQVPPAYETLMAKVPIASVPAAVQIGNALPLESISIELEFSGIPGAFELDIQEADTNADAFFQQIQLPAGAGGAKITVVSAANTARFDFNPLAAKFVRVVLQSLANNVGIRVKISGQ
ncbi:MAG TPA: hypothetical protein VIW68_12590 [Candidatus Sulfotelmatobacter sp.]